MPRGVKGSGTPKKIKPVEERIAEVDLTIEALKKQLADANALRKALIEEQQRKDTQAILDAMKVSGLNTQELLDLIAEGKYHL